MASTPEGKVKADLRAVLDEIEEGTLSRCTPATGGYGKSGVCDDLGTIASLVIGHFGSAQVGLAWNIESKGNKPPDPTPGNQFRWLDDNAKLGAFCAVISMRGFRLYDRGGYATSHVYPIGKNESRKNLCRRLVQILRSQVWTAPDFKASQLEG